MKIAEVMTRRPITVDLDEPIARIRALFAEHHCHHVLVVERGRLVGVISDRDVLRHLSPFVGTASELERDEATLARHAHQIMTRHPQVTAPDDDVEEVARRLLSAGISCFPVVRDGHHLVGIVTWRDLLRALLASHPPTLQGV